MGYVETSNIMGDCSSFIINLLLPKIVNKCGITGKGHNPNTFREWREVALFSSMCHLLKHIQVRDAIITVHHETLVFHITMAKRTLFM